MSPPLGPVEAKAHDRATARRHDDPQIPDPALTFWRQHCRVVGNLNEPPLLQRIGQRDAESPGEMSVA
jgi:hypothetical protein